jgi:hypothetical protein
MSDQSKGPEPEVGRERWCCSRGRYRQTRAGLQWAGGACDGTIRVPRPVPCPLLQILASPSCSRTIPLVRLAGPSLTARTVADVASTRCPPHSGHPLAPEAADSAPCGPWNCSVECARSRRAPHHSRRRRRVAIPASARRSAPVGRPDMFHVKRHRPAVVVRGRGGRGRPVDRCKHDNRRRARFHVKHRRHGDQMLPNRDRESSRRRGTRVGGSGQRAPGD